MVRRLRDRVNGRRPWIDSGLSSRALAGQVATAARCCPQHDLRRRCRTRIVLNLSPQRAQEGHLQRPRLAARAVAGRAGTDPGGCRWWATVSPPGYVPDTPALTPVRDSRFLGPPADRHASVCGPDKLGGPEHRATRRSPGATFRVPCKNARNLRVTAERAPNGQRRAFPGLHPHTDIGGPTRTLDRRR